MLDVSLAKTESQHSSTWVQFAPLFWSGVVHLFFFVLLFSAAMQAERLSQNQRRTIEVEFLAPPAKPETRARQQIVDSKAGQKAESAARDAYLGAETRRVNEESVAKKSGDRDIAKKPGAQAQPRQAEAAPPQVTPAPRVLTLPDQGPLSKFALALPRAPAAASATTPPPEYVRPPGDLGEASREYIKGLKESEVTALNTKEYIYFSYFQRIRERLDLAWRPILREQVVRIYQVGRRLASDQDHTTSTVVTLDAKGEVVRVQVVGESGTRDLDEAAVRAFNKAGPFPNPPTGLIESDGKVQIRWEFVLRT